MSFNQRKTLNSRPQTIKTRLSLNPIQLISDPKPRRKSSEVRVSLNKPEPSASKKRLNPETPSSKMDLSSLIKKSQEKNEKLRNQLFESLSQFKSVNQEYLKINEVIENEIENLHEDLQNLQQEFKSVDSHFVSPSKVKSLFSSPMTAASKKEVKNNKNPRAGKLIQKLKQEVSGLKKRLETVEFESKNLENTKILNDFRNMMTTAETVQDDCEKRVECKVCTLF